MFRNTWCASVTTELSNAPAAWTCDLGDTLSESNLLDPYASRYCIPPGGCQSSRKNYAQYAPGVILFCHCPPMLPLRTNGIADGTFAREGICRLAIEDPFLD